MAPPCLPFALLCLLLVSSFKVISVSGYENKRGYFVPPSLPKVSKRLFRMGFIEVRQLQSLRMKGRSIIRKQIFSAFACNNRRRALYVIDQID